MSKHKLDHPLKIGLEVHGYLNSSEKLFCMCRTTPECNSSDLINSRICPICTGQPGSKPMAPNETAVLRFIEIALILGSKIDFGDLIWQRKHYDWADNPKGYQTTISGAHCKPCAVGGRFNGINITEAHLEEDPAQWNPLTGKINYNRSGLPLIEIVTEPDFRSSEEVISWLKSLVLSLGYIKAIRKNAGIKVDVNVSTYGERVEMKNINSLDKIKKALEYEISRQLENHEKGITQRRETFAYDENLGKTLKMRDKEGASDYRFIADPDLPVLRIEKKLVEEAKKNMPEMPDVKLKKLLKEHKVDKKNAEILTSNLELVEFFEVLAGLGINMEKNLSWVTVELLRVLNYNKKTLEDVDVDIIPAHLAELIRAVELGERSSADPKLRSEGVTVLKAKQIMNDFVPKSFSLKAHKGEITNIDSLAVENMAREVVGENVHVVKEYLGGKEASLNFLIGQVMKKSERRADFKVATEMLKKVLGSGE